MTPQSTGKRLRIAARVVLAVWVLFWTYFLGANLLDNASTTPASEQTKGYVFILLGFVLVWGLTFLAWHKEKLASAVLIGLGGVLMLQYILSPPSAMQIQNVLTTAALLGALPLLSGILLWLARKR